MCELCQDRTLQKNIGLYGFISAGGENSCQRSRGVEQTLLGGAYSAASKRRGLSPGTFCIWDGAALPYPSKCSTASARWSMMSMDWGHMASQVPHWMHFEAGPSAACQE